MSFLESAALVQIGKNSREAELITAKSVWRMRSLSIFLSAR